MLLLLTPTPPLRIQQLSRCESVKAPAIRSLEGTREGCYSVATLYQPPWPGALPESGGDVTKKLKALMVSYCAQLNLVPCRGRVWLDSSPASASGSWFSQLRLVG